MSRQAQRLRVNRGGGVNLRSDILLNENQIGSLNEKLSNKWELKQMPGLCFGGALHLLVTSDTLVYASKNRKVFSIVCHL